MSGGPVQGVTTQITVLPVQPVRPAARVAGVMDMPLAAEVEEMFGVDPVAELAPAFAKPVGRAPPAGPPLSPDQVRAQAVTQATQAAAVAQGGLGPLMADLAQSANAPGLPPRIQGAIAQLLALRTGLDPSLTGAEIKQAFLKSGLFLEAQLAANAGQPQAAPGGDLKSALLIMRQALQGWLANAPARPAGRAAPAPPPPYRGGPTTAQPAASPSLPARAEPAAIGQRLLQEANASLARQELLQIASLPQSAQGPLEEAAARWMFEIPFATRQGESVAQFEISRDAKGSGAHGGATYRARFSIDLEPLGPLHAQVALRGAHAGVTLWAERPESVARLRQDQPWLVNALRAASLQAEVTVYPGSPPRAAPNAGRFLDRSL